MTTQAQAKPQPAPASRKTDADMDRLFKPVGIAAVTAAAICCGKMGKTSSGSGR